MTEKVKITQEQADAFKKLKEGQREDFEKNFKNDPDSIIYWAIPLVDLSADEFMSALYDGYEVEPSLKVGDWAKSEGHDSGEIFYGKITRIDEGRDGLRAWAMWNDARSEGFLFVDELEVMTPEEIKREKERRVWAKIGREVGEFKDGDVALERFGGVFHAVEEMEAAYQMGGLVGFYPDGSYITFEDGNPND